MNIDGTITKCRGVDVDLAEDHFMHMDECLKKYDATEVLKLDPSNMAVRVFSKLHMKSLLFIIL